MVRFKTSLSAIVSLAALKVLYRRVSLGESSIWCQNNDINSSISITYSMFSGVGDITPKLNRVYIDIFDIFEVAPVLLLLKAKILSSDIETF